MNNSLSMASFQLVRRDGGRLPSVLALLRSIPLPFPSPPEPEQSQPTNAPQFSISAQSHATLGQYFRTAASIEQTADGYNSTRVLSPLDPGANTSVQDAAQVFCRAVTGQIRDVADVHTVWHVFLALFVGSVIGHQDNVQAAAGQSWCASNNAQTCHPSPNAAFSLPPVLPMLLFRANKCASHGGIGRRGRGT